MISILFWVFVGILIYGMWYALFHNSGFDIINVDMDKYRYSATNIFQYNGNFKTPGYKLKRNAVVFVQPTQYCELWEAYDFLICDTANTDFVRGGLYLFKQGETYRIATCITSDKAGTFPPVFDGHETFITHDYVGRIIGRLDYPPYVKLF